MAKEGRERVREGIGKRDGKEGERGKRKDALDAVQIVVHEMCRQTPRTRESASRNEHVDSK